MNEKIVETELDIINQEEEKTVTIPVMSRDAYIEMLWEKKYRTSCMM